MNQPAEVQQELVKLEFPAGNVLIDMLMTTANRTRRFLEVAFDGRALQLESLEDVYVGLERLATITAPYYAQQPLQFDMGRLPPELRYLVQKGIPLPPYD